MDEREFWHLIDQTREAAGGDTDHQSAELRAQFEDRPREDLEGFARRYELLQLESYHWDVWAAGYLLAGGFGYIAHDLYQERFGEAMPTFDDISGRGEPAGEDWDEDDDTLKARFPRLWARTAES